MISSYEDKLLRWLAHRDAATPAEGFLRRLETVKNIQGARIVPANVRVFSDLACLYRFMTKDQ